MEPKRRGRPPQVDPEEVARTAVRMFVDQGFDDVTMDDVAREVGVNRRTLFRYFPSKNELVWGGSAEALERVQRELRDVSPREDPFRAAQDAYVRSLVFPEEALEVTRQRLVLIASSEALSAFGVTNRERMRQAIATFLADRGGFEGNSLEVMMRSAALVDGGHAAMLWWARFGEGPPAALVEKALGLQGGLLDEARAVGDTAGVPLHMGDRSSG